MTEWYCNIRGESSGPFSLEELRFLRERGRLTSDDFVRPGTYGPWLPTASVSGLLAAPMQSSVDLAVMSKSPSPYAEPERTIGARPERKHVNEPCEPVEQVLAGPPPGSPQSHDYYRTRQVLVGSLIGTLVVGLLVLLLLLWRPGATGGGGTVAGDGAGDSVGDDSGESPKNVGSGGVVEVAEEPDADRLQPTERSSQPQERPAERPSDSRLFVIQELPRVQEPPAEARNHNDAGLSSAGRGGGLGDFEKRLAREGAKSGEIQISLIWNNINDLDLHVVCPSGARIDFQNKRVQGGELDVDMNAGGRELSRQPVENIFWPESGPPPGNYQVYVHHYRNQGDADPTSFAVAIKINGRTRRFSGSVQAGQAPVLIHAFKIK